MVSVYACDHEVMDDEGFMRLALEQARIGLETPGAGEVGCVIVKDGVVVAAGYNEAEGSNDPSAHAEIVTLRKLGQKLGTIEFPGHTLYSTLQCCGMCRSACAWAKIDRIVYGAAVADVSSKYFEDARDIETRGGVLETECSELYAKREEDPG